MQELAHGHALSNLAAPSLIRSDGAETGRTPTKRKMLKRTPSKGGKEGAVPFIATSCEDRVGIVGAEKRTHSGSWETPETPSLLHSSRLQRLNATKISSVMFHQGKGSTTCFKLSSTQRQPSQTYLGRDHIHSQSCEFQFKNSVTQQGTPSQWRLNE